MTINCKGRVIDLVAPKVMGILNTTPDSFYDGGKYASEKQILDRVETMINEGADFIDIGGYSSKPNAEFVSESEELERILPVLKSVIGNFPKAIISIDTFRSSIARACVENGAAIINDISAGDLDKNMMATVGKLQVPYIMMHMRGTPQTMQKLTDYDDLIKEVLFYLSQKIAEARQFGINDLIIDPGFGFAKNAQQNFEMLQNMELFYATGLPMLVGISRKSMIYKSLNIKPEEALNGTTVLNTMALMKGAKILRVHDVKAAKECITLYQLTQGHEV